MAAIRSALMMLGRRSGGSSGPLVAASLGGRGLGIHTVFRSATPTTPPPPPPLRRTDLSLERWRCFSTGRVPADKDQNALRMWRRRWKNDLGLRARFLIWYAVIGVVPSTCFFVKKMNDIRSIP